MLQHYLEPHYSIHYHHFFYLFHFPLFLPNIFNQLSNVQLYQYSFIFLQKFNYIITQSQKVNFYNSMEQKQQQKKQFIIKKKRIMSLKKQEDRKELKKDTRYIFKSLDKQKQQQKQWNIILKTELKLQPTIRDFQSIQMNIAEQLKKHLIRQNYLIKKQAISHIINRNTKSLIQKLKILYEKSINQEEKINAWMFLEFIKIKQYIKQHHYQYKLQIIKKIYVIVQQCSKFQFKVKLIHSKTLMIYSLFLLKLKGIFIDQTDRTYIAKAIQFKRKQFQMNSNKQQKEDILKCLIFSSFYYYRILSLLKHDQDERLVYYDNLITYLKLLSQNERVYNKFQSQNRIQQKLQNFKPLALNIQPYQDSKNRRILSLQNNRGEMLNIPHKLPNAVIVNRRQSKIEQFSFLESTKRLIINRQSQRKSNRQSRNSNFKQNKPSPLKLFAGGNNTISKAIAQMLSQNNLTKETKYNFNFILKHSLRLIVGKFEIKEKKEGLYDIHISLKSNEVYVGILVIRNIVKKKDRFIFDVWKIIKEKMNKIQNRFIKLAGYLYFAIDNTPLYLDEEQLIVLNQIYEVILKYFRIRFLLSEIVGPTFLLSQSNNPQVNLSTQTQKYQRIFNKRIGFINQQQSYRTDLVSTDQEIGINFIYIQSQSFKVVRIVYSKMLLKQVIIIQMGMVDKSQILSKKLRQQSLSSIKKMEKKKLVTKVIKFINSIEWRKFNYQATRSLNQYKQLRDRQSNSSSHKKLLKNEIDYNLEQVSISLNIAKKCPFKDYWMKRNDKLTKLQIKGKIIKKEIQNVKISVKIGKKIKLLIRTTYEYFYIYSNNNLSFIQLKFSNKKEIQKKEVQQYRKIRMYNSFVIPLKQGQFQRYYKKQNTNKLYTLKQKICTIIHSHKILRLPNQYIIIIEHSLIVQFQNFHYAYEIVHKVDKYIKFSQNKISNYSDQIKHQFINNRHQMSRIQCRGQLSDITQYINAQLLKKKKL